MRSRVNDTFAPTTIEERHRYLYSLHFPLVIIEVWEQSMGAVGRYGPRASPPLLRLPILFFCSATPFLILKPPSNKLTR